MSPARIDPGQNKVMAALLGTDQPQDLVGRVECDTVALLVPDRHGLPEGEHAFLLVRGVAVVLGDLRSAAELVDDTVRGGLHGVADGQADDVHAVGLCLVDLLAQLHEQIGGDLR